MMLRRILYNIFFAFVILPFLSITKRFIECNLFGDCSSFSGSLWEFIPVVFKGVVPVISGGFLMMVLLPYNVFLLYSGSNKKYSLVIKIAVFTVIELLASSLTPMFMYMYYSISYFFLIFCGSLILAIVFVTLHYWLIDRFHEQKK